MLISACLPADGATALRYTQVSTYGYTGLGRDRRATDLLTGQQQ
jgi:hypothetical protein